MLCIRLLRMNKFVDLFLIFTTNETYTGIPLRISFAPFESCINKYKHKIIIYNFTYPSHCITPIYRENYQRMSIPSVIRSFHINNESIIVISDVDEIPTAEAMRYIIKNPPIKFYMLSGYMYYYNYRNKFKVNWPGVIVIKLLNCNKSIQTMRNKRYALYKTDSIPINPSLTHCSFCYNSIAYMQKKLKSLAYLANTNYSKPPYTDSNYIENCIKNHIHLLTRKSFVVVEYNNTLLPLPNDIRFNYLKQINSIK